MTNYTNMSANISPITTLSEEKYVAHNRHSSTIQKCTKNYSMSQKTGPLQSI